ncbi:MAG TPA: YsnF/AvaK domain-containing protein [Parafilimonas sp.]|nr:YsnF/AvaK domain-containing protein [Parafilimonas sp.]
MSHIVVGIFNNADEAKNAVDKLVNSGFDRSNVDYARGSDSGYYTDDENRNDNESGISRFFKDLFDNKDESNRYTRVAKDRYVVTVHTEAPGEAHRASELLDEYGAVDVDEKDHEFTMQNKNADDTYSNRPNYNPDVVNERNRSYDDVRANRQKDDTYFNDTNKESKKIPVIQEDLEIGKKIVETGGIRLRSRIIEKPVEKTIRLREEHVNVERTKVNRPATDEDFNNFKEETVEMREHGEVPVVNKNAKVVEEVSVNKKVNEREETVRDNVRRKEVDVENVAANNSKRSDR